MWKIFSERRLKIMQRILAPDGNHRLKSRIFHVFHTYFPHFNIFVEETWKKCGTCNLMKTSGLSETITLFHTSTLISLKSIFMFYRGISRVQEKRAKFCFSGSLWNLSVETWKLLFLSLNCLIANWLSVVKNSTTKCGKVWKVWKTCGKCGNGRSTIA